MFGIGTPELLLILAVALIVIGPKKLPDLAKSLGRAMGEFKRATSDLKQSLEQESGLGEVRDKIKEAKQDLLNPPTSAQAAADEASQTQDDLVAAEKAVESTDGLEHPPIREKNKE